MGYHKSRDYVGNGHLVGRDAGLDRFKSMRCSVDGIIPADFSNNPIVHHQLDLDKFLNKAVLEIGNIAFGSSGGSFKIFADTCRKPWKDASNDEHYSGEFYFELPAVSSSESVQKFSYDHHELYFGQESSARLFSSFERERLAQLDLLYLRAAIDKKLTGDRIGDVPSEISHNGCKEFYLGYLVD